MEKRKLKLSRIILWELVVPLFGTVLFTVLFAVLQKNYYYLPRGLDFLIQLFYNAKYIFLYASLFFFAGISAWIVLFARGRDAAVLSVTGVLSVAIMPMISFAVALLLLRNDISDSLIENYLYSDALCALENAARYVIVIFLTVATRIFYHAHKTVPTFEKPYMDKIMALYKQLEDTKKEHFRASMQVAELEEKLEQIENTQPKPQNDFKAPEDTIDMAINYCPICGRKLVE